MTYKLLIVDDEMANLRLLERLFRHDYYCLTASSGDEAIKLLEQHDVAVIITDQRMPQMTGIELLKKTAETRQHMVRILLTGYTDMEALVEAINCGLVYMYVTKPWNNEDLKLRVSRALEHYTNNRKRHELETANQRLFAKNELIKAGFVRSLSEALRMREPQMYQHSSRVSEYAAQMAEAMELSEEVCKEIAAAAMLHEIGALGHATGVACWPAQANREGSSCAQKQSDRAVEMLAALPDFKEIADIIRFQHESVDGSGTPRGLFGDQIPIGSRIIRTAAEYELMTNTSSADKLSHQQAIAGLQERAGSALDADLVQTLARIAADNVLDSTTLCSDPLMPNLFGGRGILQAAGDI